MKKLTQLFALIGFVALLGALAFEGYRIRQWKKHVDVRSYYAEQSGAYIFGDSGVILKSTGEALNRQQLMDYLLRAAVVRNPELAFKETK